MARTKRSENAYRPAPEWRRFRFGSLLYAVAWTIFFQTAIAAENPSQSNPQVAAGQQALFSRLEGLWVEHDAQNRHPDRENEQGRTAALATDETGEGHAAPPAPLSPSSAVEPLGSGDTEVLRAVNIGVFENEEFELCGHTRFKVALSGRNPDYDKLLISSRDRTIPGIPFRGFETLVALETKTDLWPGCSVIAGYVDISGIIRIGLSVREKVRDK